MNFYINIIDTLNDEYTTILENAQKNAIVLSYAGSDDKDDLQLVGSTLSFNMQVPQSNNVDAAFIDLFTGDEQRFLVEIRKETDDTLIWHGYLLPDSYDEPYKNGTFFVGFEATDGIGRLKGKYLPDAYYTSEKSVVDIIAKCLSLTGLEMNLVFAPGIDNRVQKDWNSIYVNGENFVKNDKYQDAYSILEAFAFDMLFRVYQHLGVWRIEGLNKAELLSYSAKQYTYDATFISNTTVNKVVKNVIGKALTDPSITMVPPYNTVTIEHEQVGLQLPKTLSQEVNDGWVNDPGVVSEIYATDWFGYNNFYAKAKVPNYKVFLQSNNTSTFDATKKVSLLQTVYVHKNTKIKFNLELSIDIYGLPSNDTVSALIEAGYWTNPIKYQVMLNNNTIYGNIGLTFSSAENIQFGTDKKAQVTFEFINTTAGNLTIDMFQPVGVITTTRIQGIFIEDVSFETIGFNETLLFEDTLNEDYTVDKEIELTFADNANGLGKVFRLAKLQANNNNFNVISVPIINGFTQNGINYSVVTLKDANLIADNINSVNYNNLDTEQLEPLSNLQVIYNLNGGEQHVIVTDELYDSSEFVVVQRKYNVYDLDRTHWEQWTDSVYEIESKRYPEAVMNVYRRLFSLSQPKIDLQAKLPILFGDIVQWNYIDTYNYVVTNVSGLNFDNGQTSITIAKAVYQQGDTQIPPIVDAGNDIYITDAQTSVNLNATAYDPDGTIVSYLWEKVSGAAGDIIVSSTTEDTQLNNLTGDEYEYKITVTDNDGLTASDTVRVIRIVDYTVTLPVNDFSNDYDDGTPDYESYSRQYLYDVVVTPNIPVNETINFQFQVTLSNYMQEGTGEVTATSIVKIYKNSAVIAQFELSDEGTQTFNSVFNYISTDVIQVYLQASVYHQLVFFVGPDVTATATFSLNFGSLIDYPGTVLGLPITYEILADLD